MKDELNTKTADEESWYYKLGKFFLILFLVVYILYAVLGFITMSVMSGYDIKVIVDSATVFIPPIIILSIVYWMKYWMKKYKDK